MVTVIPQLKVVDNNFSQGKRPKPILTVHDNNKITFYIDDDPILILTSKGFNYKGEYIKDSKDACTRLHEWLDTALKSDKRSFTQKD